MNKELLKSIIECREAILALHCATQHTSDNYTDSDAIEEHLEACVDKSHEVLSLALDLVGEEPGSINETRN